MTSARDGYDQAIATLRDAAIRSGSRAFQCAADYLEADPDRLAPAKPTPAPWEIRAQATGGGMCRCGKPFYTHVCLTCSAPDYVTPGRGCDNCRHTGMDQTPCQPKEEPR